VVTRISPFEQVKLVQRVFFYLIRRKKMIDLKNINVQFDMETHIVNAVKDVSLSVEESDIYGIVGYSGAGKSTLVRTMNLLQEPTSGEVHANGQNLLSLNPKDLRSARKKIGMIFQHFNLMNSRTVSGNVHYALRSSDLSKEEKNQRVTELLELVGLEDRQDSYPSQLSGGQKQRVGIARALANDPKVLLCDEATSSLDPKTTLSILELLKDLNEKLGLTIVIITHEMEVIKEICNKVAVMEDGEIIEQGDIVHIFTEPDNQLTKEFINTATHIDQALDKLANHSSVLNIGIDDEIAQLSFKGGSAGEPLVSDLYSRFSVSTNILYGNVEILQNTAVGNLIVVFQGNTDHLKEAIHYLDENDVGVQLLEKVETDNRNLLINKNRKESYVQ